MTTIGVVLISLLGVAVFVAILWGWGYLAYEAGGRSPTADCRRCAALLETATFEKAAGRRVVEVMEKAINDNRTVTSQMLDAAVLRETLLQERNDALLKLIAGQATQLAELAGASVSLGATAPRRAVPKPSADGMDVPPFPGAQTLVGNGHFEMPAAARMRDTEGAEVASHVARKVEEDPRQRELLDRAVAAGANPTPRATPLTDVVGVPK